jgi:hypothetical protein
MGNVGVNTNGPHQAVHYNGNPLPVGSASTSGIAGPGHHYMGIEDVMQWLEAHLGKVTDQLQSAMGDADARAEMIKQVGDLKAQIKDHQVTWEQWKKNVDDVAKAHPDDADLQTFAKGVDAAFEPKTVKVPVPGGSMDMTVPASDPTTDQASAWGDELASKLDSLNKDDQLAMVQINALVAKMNQSLELASNMISSMNQAFKSTIDNIR